MNVGYPRVAATVAVMPDKRKPTSLHRPDHAVLAQLLRELRVASGMTQVEAAASLGIAQTGISDLEASDRVLPLLVVRDLVGIYGGDWIAFIKELEKRLQAGTKPASTLLRKKSAVPSKPRTLK